MFTEALETRRMFAVSAYLSGGALVVEGDAANNQLFVYKNPSTDRLNVYDTTVPSWSLLGSWPSSSVSSIFMFGNAGNDSLSVDHSIYRRIHQPANLWGGDGNDTLTGGGGNDYLVGGAGTDVADYSYRSESLSLALDGLANDGPVGGTERDNIHHSIEQVFGGSGNDMITGNGSANFLKGNGGNDTIFANGGNDWVLGGAGDDTLYGDGGSDVVSGEDGNDFVSGHRGHYDGWDNATDHLIGGLGSDILVGYDGYDYYTSNDDGGQVDRLYVRFNSDGVADRVLADSADRIF